MPAPGPGLLTVPCFWFFVFRRMFFCESPPPFRSSFSSSTRACVVQTIHRNHAERMGQNMDSLDCSRVSSLVVALGLFCTCCTSFMVLPGPLMQQQHSAVLGGRRLAKAVVQPTRMMAGDLDVSCILGRKKGLKRPACRFWKRRQSALKRAPRGRLTRSCLSHTSVLLKSAHPLQTNQPRHHVSRMKGHSKCHATRCNILDGDSRHDG